MTAQQHRHPHRQAIRSIEAIRRLCVHNSEAQEHALDHCRWCPFELLKDLGSLALVSGDDIGELFERRLAHPVSSSLEVAHSLASDLEEIAAFCRR
jgi:hypothetical protein